MKRFSLVGLIVLVVSTTSFAATPIDERIGAAGVDSLYVSNVAGVVTITGSNRDDVHVTGSLADEVEGLEVSRNGNRINVVVLYPELQRGRQDLSAVLDIQAPEELSVTIDTVSANISVEAMQGEQTLSSVSGSIETELRAAELRAQSVSGAIFVDGRQSGARLDVSSVSGRIELDDIGGGEVSSNNVSGSISLRGSNMQRAELANVSGRIDVEVTLSNDGRLRAETTSGAISMQLDGSPAGRYEIASFSGAIDNCFGPAPDRPRFGPPSSRLQFEEPNARVQVYANSMSGSIDICK